PLAATPGPTTNIVQVPGSVEPIPESPTASVASTPPSTDQPDGAQPATAASQDAASGPAGGTATAGSSGAPVADDTAPSVATGDGEPEHRDESGGKEREEQPAEEQDRPRLVELAVPVRRPVGPLPLGLGTLEVGLLHPTQADTPASGLAENRTVSEDALKTG